MVRLLAVLTLALPLALPACLVGDAPAPAGVPASAPANAQAATPTPLAAGPVLVELFTSEGCSSCPPADALLADLAGRPGVVALSFHVDYWDRLGWRDPFSSAAATARQQSYAQSLGDNRVYTPEMVVGGAVGFVGSRRGEAERAIAAAAPADAVPVTVAAHVRGRSVEAAVRADGLAAGQVVHVALVQRAATSRVGRGENRGRALRHVGVVRAFATVTGGTLRLTLPAGLQAGDVRVVAFAQAGETGPVLGVATADVTG